MLVASSSCAVCCVDFSIGAKVFTSNKYMGILCKLSCLEQVSGLILLVHTEMLYFKPLQTLLGVPYVNKLKIEETFH